MVFTVLWVPPFLVCVLVIVPIIHHRPQLADKRLMAYSSGHCNSTAEAALVKCDTQLASAWIMQLHSLRAIQYKTLRQESDV